MRLADAATLASRGQLSVPPDARLMVISTDTAMQQVLSEDFAVARRSKPSGPSRTLTLTVAVFQRVLQPEVSMIGLAPGVPHVAELIKAAGYKPVEQTGGPMTGDVAEYVARGNPAVAAYKGNAAAGNPPANPFQPNPGRDQLDQLLPYSPGPPRAPDPRDPMNRPVPPPDYTMPSPARIYDTALIAHVVLSDGKGEMTIVAVAHPNEDIHAVKKQLAERIANVVLH